MPCQSAALSFFGSDGVDSFSSLVLKQQSNSGKKKNSEIWLGVLRSRTSIHMILPTYLFKHFLGGGWVLCFQVFYKPTQGSFQSKPQYISCHFRDVYVKTPLIEVPVAIALGSFSSGSQNLQGFSLRKGFPSLKPLGLTKQSKKEIFILFIIIFT